MTNRAFDKSLDVSAVAHYIAEGTRQIVNTMKEADVDKNSSLEKDIVKLSDQSHTEKDKAKQKFDEERARVREQFHRKHRRY
ncbi:MAG TPA: hypothetical protein VE944_12540 [Nostoc sp.]|uniref:hypothetical protein n=1 Tax=Nostoc sp. TaxID=1180 RepID=UPI002D4616FE|nr:hypothetical protein [Nostoc sp.]HYX15171.1 hypothetical protein [Nostoc sp.]